MDAATLADVASKAVTSTAVLIGGGWAYIKFIRGRTFAYRAELQLDLDLVQLERSRLLQVILTLTNTGLSRIALNERMKAIRIHATTNTDAHEVRPARWQRVLTTSCFEHHDWLEAQESVTDELLYQLPASGDADPRQVAYQVEAIVGAKPRTLTGTRVRWHARKIVQPPGATTPLAAPSPAHHPAASITPEHGLEEHDDGESATAGRVQR